MLSGAAEPLNKCKLKVAWEDWRPYIYKEQDELQGIEYSYLMKLANKTGCTLQFVEQPWVRSLISLKIGTVDILYGASYTKERDSFAEFSVPYRYEEFVFISNDIEIRQEISILSWIDEQKNENTPKTIGLIRGFNYGNLLEPIVRNPSGLHRTQEVRRDDQLEEMLKLNRIDGFIVEKLVAEQMINNVPSFKISHIEEAEPIYLMFSNMVNQDITI